MFTRLVTTVVSVGVISLIGVWLFEGRRIVAKVGDFKIYQEDIEARNRLHRLQYPGSKDEVGYAQLEKSYINYQIMRNYGYRPIETRLATESKRIDATTRNPEMLKKIKTEIFKNKKNSYERAFVIPAAVNEEVYFGFFDSEDKIHLSSQRQAEDVLAQLKQDPGTLKAIAEKAKLKYFLYQVSPISVSVVDPKTMKPLPRAPEEELKPKPTKKETSPNGGSEDGQRIELSYQEQQAKYWNNEILKGLRAGDVIRHPVSAEEQWYVGRVLKLQGKDTIVELVSVPKVTFSEFFESEKSKVAVRKGFFLF